MEIICVVDVCGRRPVLQYIAGFLDSELALTFSAVFLFKFDIQGLK